MKPAAAAAARPRAPFASFCIARTKLTYEDFLQFPDDGKRHEIIDGVHYVTASPLARHQLILGVSTT